MLVIVNFILYFFSLLFLFRRKRDIDVGNIIFACYTIVSFFCIINYYLSPQDWDLSLFPFIYLFIIVCIALYPFNKYNFSIQANPINNYKLYKLIANFYIIISLFSCIIYLQDVINAINNSEWAALYEDAHSENTNGGILKTIANLFFHLRYLGLVLFFSFSSLRNEKRFFLTLLGFSSVLPIAFVAIINASRGGIVSLIVSFFITFIIFRRIIDVKIKKVIWKFAMITIPVFAIYMISVTVSRFASSAFAENAGSSVINYLGHSMLTFNYGVYDTVENYSFGKFMFKLPPVDLITSLDQYYNTHISTNFFTLAGTLIFDFGPFLSILVISLVSNIFLNFTKKRFLDVADIFLVLYYALFVYDGVFVHGRGYGYQWIETIIIYILLKFLSRIK